MLLGFLVAALAIVGTRKAETVMALMIPVIALGIPMLDTTLAVVRRWSRKLPISASDRGHIHHILLSLGLSHRQVVLLLYAACLVLGGAAFLLTAGRSEVTLLVLGPLGILAFVCVHVFGGVRAQQLWSRLSEDWQQRQHSAEARTAVEKAIRRMRMARTVEDLWQACGDAFGGLALDVAKLTLRGREADEVLTWPASSESNSLEVGVKMDVWQARFGLSAPEGPRGELELRKNVGNATLLADAPELVERLRREMGSQIGRVWSVGLPVAEPSVVTGQ
jgi:UDP-GlcNAc:undecaprenyl-phosphate GlcNAc-1-phosphate transferase